MLTKKKKKTMTKNNNHKLPSLHPSPPPPRRPSIPPAQSHQLSLSLCGGIDTKNVPTASESENNDPNATVSPPVHPSAYQPPRDTSPTIKTKTRVWHNGRAFFTVHSRCGAGPLVAEPSGWACRPNGSRRPAPPEARRTSGLSGPSP